MLYNIRHIEPNRYSVTVHIYSICVRLFSFFCLCTFTFTCDLLTDAESQENFVGAKPRHTDPWVYKRHFLAFHGMQSLSPRNYEHCLIVCWYFLYITSLLRNENEEKFWYSRQSISPPTFFVRWDSWSVTTMKHH